MSLGAVLVLTEMLRWTGVVVALAGSIFAAPEAVLGVSRRAQRRARQLGARAAALRRWLTGGRHLAVQIHDAAAAGDAAGSVSLSSAAMGVSGSALGDRVTVLEAELTQVRTDLDLLRQSQAIETEERHRALVELEERLTGAVAEVRQTVIAMERDATEVDLTALPLVGLGVLVSGVPEYLAAFWPVAVVFLAGSVAFFVWSVRRFVGHLRRLRASPADRAG